MIIEYIFALIFVFMIWCFLTSGFIEQVRIFKFSSKHNVIEILAFIGFILSEFLLSCAVIYFAYGVIINI